MKTKNIMQYAVVLSLIVVLLAENVQADEPTTFSSVLTTIILPIGLTIGLIWFGIHSAKKQNKEQEKIDDSLNNQYKKSLSPEQSSPENFSSEEQKYLVPFDSVLHIADSNYLNKFYLNAIKSYFNFVGLLDIVPAYLDKVNPMWGTFNSNIRNKVQLKLAQDTIGIGSKIEDCQNSFKKQNASVLFKVDSIENKKKVLSSEVEKINTHLFVVSGEVKDIQNDTYTIYGKALPIITYLRQLGYSNVTEMFGGMFGDKLGEEDMSKVEGIPGVLTSANYIEVKGYNSANKISGNMIIGQEIASTGYTFVSHEGGVGSPYYYMLSPQQAKVQSLNTQINALDTQRETLFSSIGLTGKEYTELFSEKTKSSQQNPSGR